MGVPNLPYLLEAPTVGISWIPDERIIPVVMNTIIKMNNIHTHLVMLSYITSEPLTLGGSSAEDPPSGSNVQ